jgi:hypothetical protein
VGSPSERLDGVNDVLDVLSFAIGLNQILVGIEYTIQQNGSGSGVPVHCGYDVQYDLIVNL